MIGIQVSKQLPYLDLSKDNYLVEYGKALLDPLPQDAILVTTYDIQWTVTRYLQECESHRTWCGVRAWWGMDDDSRLLDQTRKSIHTNGISCNIRIIKT